MLHCHITSTFSVSYSISGIWSCVPSCIWVASYFIFCSTEGFLVGKSVCWAFQNFLAVGFPSGDSSTVWLHQTPVREKCGQFFKAEGSCGTLADDSSELIPHQMAHPTPELSSHRIPHRLEGTTTAKGLYGKSDFEFYHYAFGGVCATSALCTLALHFGFGSD